MENRSVNSSVKSQIVYDFIGTVLGAAEDALEAFREAGTPREENQQEVTVDEFYAVVDKVNYMQQELNELRKLVLNNQKKVVDNAKKKS